MSAETTPTPVVIVPAEETTNSAPAARRHSRTSRAKKAAELTPTDGELIAIVEEKRQPTHPPAAEALNLPGVREVIVEEWRRRKAAAEAEAKKAEEAAEAAKKVAAAEIIAAFAPPQPAPTAEKAEGNVVQLRPPPAAKPWQPRPAPTAAEAEAFQASIPVVVPTLVFLGWEYAAGFRLCLLKAEQELRLELVEALSEAYGRLLRERRSFVLDTLNKGVNPVLERLYGFPDMRKEGAKAAKAPTDVIADVRQRLADAGWDRRLDLPERPAEQKPETAKEKAAREAAEAKALEEKKAAAEAKDRLIGEIKKMLVAAGCLETALEGRSFRVLNKTGSTAGEKFTAAALGSREAQASAEKAGQADQVEHHRKSVALYAKAAGVELATIEAKYAEKVAEREAQAKAAQAAHEAAVAKGVPIARPMGEIAQARERERDEAAKKAKKEKNAAKKGGEGKGGK